MSKSKPALSAAQYRERAQLLGGERVSIAAEERRAASDAAFHEGPEAQQRQSELAKRRADLDREIGKLEGLASEAEAVEAQLAARKAAVRRAAVYRHAVELSEKRVLLAKALDRGIKEIGNLCGGIETLGNESAAVIHQEVRSEGGHFDKSLVVRDVFPFILANIYRACGRPLPNELSAFADDRGRVVGLQGVGEAMHAKILGRVPVDDPHEAAA